jgi:hypothetical protein
MRKNEFFAVGHGIKGRYEGGPLDGQPAMPRGRVGGGQWSRSRGAQGQTVKLSTSPHYRIEPESARGQGVVYVWTTNA